MARSRGIAVLLLFGTLAVLPGLVRAEPLPSSPFAAGTGARPVEIEADDAELLNEFLLSDAVYTQAPRQLQLTLGFAGVGKAAAGQQRHTLVAELGITERLQLSTELSFLSGRLPVGAARGLSEVGLGAGYSVAKDLRRLAVTAGLGLSVSTRRAAEEAGSERTRFEPFVVLGRQVGKGQLHMGFSAEIGDETEWGYSLAAVYPWSRWRGLLELNGVGGAEPALSLTPGFVWFAGPGLEIALGAPVRLSGAAPDAGLLIKITRER